MNVYLRFRFSRKWNFIFVGIFVYGRKWKCFSSASRTHHKKVLVLNTRLGLGLEIILDLVMVKKKVLFTSLVTSRIPSLTKSQARLVCPDMWCVASLLGWVQPEQPRLFSVDVDWNKKWSDTIITVLHNMLISLLHLLQAKELLHVLYKLFTSFQTVSCDMTFPKSKLILLKIWLCSRL